MRALPDASCPGGSRGARTVRSTGAYPTDRLPEGKTDGGRTMSIWSLQPDDTPLPLRAERVCGVPIDPALGGSEAVSCLPWPASIVHRRTNQVYVVVRTTRPEVVGGDIAYSDDLFPRCELAGGPLCLNRRPHDKIGGRGRCGRHSGEQGGRLIVTGFSDMHLVARPFRLALFAIAGCRVLGRADAHWCWGQILSATPAPWLVMGPRVALLQPHLPQRLDGRERP